MGSAIALQHSSEIHIVVVSVVTLCLMVGEDHGSAYCIELRRRFIPVFTEVWALF
jgi:hypothetical protein